MTCILCKRRPATIGPHCLRCRTAIRRAQARPPPPEPEPDHDEDDHLATLKADLMKNWTTCLGCGKKLWTDRCHRLCKKCGRRNEATPVGRPPCRVWRGDAAWKEDGQ